MPLGSGCTALAYVGLVRCAIDKFDVLVEFTFELFVLQIGGAFEWSKSKYSKWPTGFASDGCCSCGCCGCGICFVSVSDDDDAEELL